MCHVCCNRICWSKLSYPYVTAATIILTCDGVSVESFLIVYICDLNIYFLCHLIMMHFPMNCMREGCHILKKFDKSGQRWQTLDLLLSQVGFLYNWCRVVVMSIQWYTLIGSILCIVSVFFWLRAGRWYEVITHNRGVLSIE